MRITLFRRHLLALLFGVLFCASTTLQARQGIEPLTAAEAQRATQLTLNAIATENLTGAGAVTHVLRSVVHDPGKYNRANARQAHVFVYDYSANRLIVSRVNLLDDSVTSLNAMSDKQPPLTETEVGNARTMTLDDPDTLEQIHTEYLAITGESLNDPSQLTFHIRGFNPALAQGRTNARSENCVSRRCARVTIVVGDSTLFRIVPIVDLASGQVLQHIGFGPSNNQARRLLRRERQNRRGARGSLQSGANHGTHNHANGTQQ